MKFKMAEKSLFAVLLRSPWWISMLVAAAIVLLAKVFGPAQYADGMALGGFPFVVIGLLALRRQWGLPSDATLADLKARVQAMGWPDFSKALQAAYLAQGYQVKPGNGAADFEMTKGARTTLVLARRWKAANQGVQQLQALVAQQKAQDASACVVVCLEPLSQAAALFAKTNAVVHLDASGLAQLLMAKPASR